jgi:hypothetical protein
MSSAQPPQEQHQDHRSLPHELLGLVLGVVVLAIFLLVLGRSDRFPAADGSFMLYVARLVGQDIASAPGSGLLHLATLSKPHPPLGYLPPLLLSGWLPLRWVVAVSSTFSLGLLLDALVRIGRPFPPWGSILVGAIAIGSALTWWSADHYGFDLVGAAVAMQALSWLQASRGLTRRRPALLFGLWLGVTFATKYSAPIPLVLPTVALCGIALFRRPRNVLVAIGGWAAVTLPWLLLNANQVLAYARSSVTPADNPANHQTAMTLQERLLGDGWTTVSAAMDDALGMHVLVLALVAVLLARRWALLLALVGGVVLLSTYNDPHGRHTLPLLFVLAGAAIPTIPAGSGTPRKVLAWGTAVVLGGLGITSFVSSSTTYDLKGVQLPPVRDFVHDAATFSSIAPWPFPAEQFGPLSWDVEGWRIAEVSAAVAQHSPGRADVLLFSNAAIQPGLSVYGLVTVVNGYDVAWSEAHTKLMADGSVMVETMIPPEIHPRYAYLVMNAADRQIGERWLASRGHQELLRLPLVSGTEGVLVALDAPFVPEERWSKDAFRGGAD